jgi:hypothetical protein
MAAEFHRKFNATSVNQEIKSKYFRHFGTNFEFSKDLKRQVFKKGVPENQLKSFVAVSVAFDCNILSFPNDMINL